MDTKLTIELKQCNQTDIRENLTSCTDGVVEKTMMAESEEKCDDDSDSQDTYTSNTSDSTAISDDKTVDNSNESENVYYIDIPYDSFVHTSLSLGGAMSHLPDESHLEIESPQFATQEYQITPFCIKHPGEILLMFCKECKISICRNCVIENHQKHDLGKIEDHLVENSLQTAKCLDMLTVKFKTCQNFVKSLENREEVYSREIIRLIQAFEENRDKLKSDLDRVTDDMIQGLKNRENQDLNILAQQKSYYQSKLSDIRESVTKCEQKLLNKSDVEITTDSVTEDLTPPKLLFIPKYFSKIPHTLYLQSHVGILLAFPIFTFNPQVYLDLVVNITPNEAFFGCHGKPGVYKITKNGSNLQKIRTISNDSKFYIEDIIVEDIAVTSSGVLVMSEFNGHNLWKYLPDTNKFGVVTNLQPHLTRGICTSSEDNVFICLNLKNHDKVVKVSLSGEMLQTIPFANVTSLTQPMRVKESKHGNIYILQYNITQNSIDLVAMDNNGTFLFLHNAIGRMKVGNICTFLDIDKYENVLISNHDRSRLYLFDPEKKSLRYVKLKTRSGRSSITSGISVDEDGLLWVCNCYDENKKPRTEVSIMKI